MMMMMKMRMKRKLNFEYYLPSYIDICIYIYINGILLESRTL